MCRWDENVRNPFALLSVSWLERLLQNAGEFSFSTLENYEYTYFGNSRIFEKESKCFERKNEEINRNKSKINFINSTNRDNCFIKHITIYGFFTARHISEIPESRELQFRTFQEFSILEIHILIGKLVNSALTHIPFHSMPCDAILHDAYDRICILFSRQPQQSHTASQ